MCAPDVRTKLGSSRQLTLASSLDCWQHVPRLSSPIANRSRSLCFRRPKRDTIDGICRTDISRDTRIFAPMTTRRSRSRSALRAHLTRARHDQSSRQRRRSDEQQQQQQSERRHIAANRRKRSRSQSRSRSSSSERKLHPKKQKQKKKKNKRHKEKQPQHVRGTIQEEEAERVEVDVALVQCPVQPITEPEDKEPVQALPLDVKSFFEQLQRQEVAKKPVGTVHSRGIAAPVSATAVAKSDKWECSKATCGHTNSKHAPACTKCGAMKRMTEWR